MKLCPGQIDFAHARADDRRTPKVGTRESDEGPVAGGHLEQPERTALEDAPDELALGECRVEERAGGERAVHERRRRVGRGVEAAIAKRAVGKRGTGARRVEEVDI